MLKLGAANGPDGTDPDAEREANGDTGDANGAITGPTVFILPLWLPAILRFFVLPFCFNLLAISPISSSRT